MPTVKYKLLFPVSFFHVFAISSDSRRFEASPLVKYHGPLSRRRPVQLFSTSPFSLLLVMLIPISTHDELPSVVETAARESIAPMFT